MDVLRTDDHCLIRIDRGEEVIASITAALNEENIRTGSLSGIGAADRVTLRYYSLKDKQYHNRSFEDEFEIASLTGNVSVLDGAPWPHIHAVFADTEYRCFGGHLASARISVTGEVIIRPLSASLHREHDERTGLKLWSW